MGMTQELPTRTSERTMAIEYDRLLHEFVRLGKRLIARGQPYLAVILSHDLFRFLYPFEPYARFKNMRPVSFICRKIRRLIELGNGFASSVLPYRWDRWSWNPASELRSQALEKRTSELYSSLWKTFDFRTLWDEGVELLRKRLPASVIGSHIVGREVLDLGCGSGRYTIALARLGAKRVVGLDVQRQSYVQAEALCQAKKLPVQFYEGDCQRLPLREVSFDFVFCNGVLHHSRSVRKGLQELFRVLKGDGQAFLYLYGTGGIFWKTRRAIRAIFRKIPVAYTQKTLEVMGLPSNRFIFCDTWYVPREAHTSRQRLERMLDSTGFSYEKIVSDNPFDLDRALEEGIRGGQEMWGDGEHRYLLRKQNS